MDSRQRYPAPFLAVLAVGLWGCAGGAEPGAAGAVDPPGTPSPFIPADEAVEPDPIAAEPDPDPEPAPAANGPGSRPASSGSAMHPVTAAPNGPMDPAEPVVADLPVTLNEVRASSEDWIELYNPGPPFDLSGYRIAQAGESGEPDLGTAAIVPDGTLLQTGDRLLVVANLGSMAEPGFQSTCLDRSGPPTCLHASWGISDSRGDTLFLVDTTGEVLERLDYPALAAPSGQSYGRLPDGTGPFAPGRLTPGAANEAP